LEVTGNPYPLHTTDSLRAVVQLSRAKAHFRRSPRRRRPAAGGVAASDGNEVATEGAGDDAGATVGTAGAVAQDFAELVGADAGAGRKGRIHVDLLWLVADRSGRLAKSPQAVGPKGAGRVSARCRAT